MLGNVSITIGKLNILVGVGVKWSPYKYTDGDGLVAKLGLTLCKSMDCNPPGSSVHGIFQARILEWVALCSSRGSSQPRDQRCVSCIGRQDFFLPLCHLGGAT